MRNWRKMTWFIIFWTLAMALQWGLAPGNSSEAITIPVLWFIGFIIFAIIWFMRMPRNNVVVFGPQGQQVMVSESEAKRRVESQGWTYNGSSTAAIDRERTRTQLVPREERLSVSPRWGLCPEMDGAGRHCRLKYGHKGPHEPATEMGTADATTPQPAIAAPAPTRPSGEPVSSMAAVGEAPIAVQAAVSPDIPDQLRKLGDLRDAGILTPEEFDSKKADLLARM